MTENVTRRAILAAAPAASILIGGAAVAAADIAGKDVREAPVPGGGLADDGPILRKAISGANVQGEKIWLPKGQFVAGGEGDAVLTLTAPISIEGEGSAASVLNPVLASSEEDTIRLSPNTLFDHSGITLSGFALQNPVDGRRRGRHGIYLDTTAAGQNLPRLTLEGLSIGAGSGLAVLHQNDPAKNPNGGLYSASIRDNQLRGGLRLNGSGDNISIYDNIISGHGLGIDIALISGASCISVERCNITSSGGAIRHRSGSRPTYTGLNIENVAPGALAENDGAVVNISGERGTVVGGCLTDSLVSAFGRSDATHLIRVSNTRGFTLDRLTLLSGQVRPLVALEIADDAWDTKVGTLQMQTGKDGRFVMPIIDHGVGTMGVVKTAALTGGWEAPQSGDAPLQFLKSVDGVVRLWGSVVGGGSADGTPIATLPRGFRPSGVVYLPATARGKAGIVTGEVAIARDGIVRLAGLSGAQAVRISGGFPAALLGHAASPE